MPYLIQKRKPSDNPKFPPQFRGITDSYRTVYEGDLPEDIVELLETQGAQALKQFFYKLDGAGKYRIIRYGEHSRIKGFGGEVEVFGLW